jgi:two-component system, OmpR family, sensor histidine kinase VicK
MARHLQGVARAIASMPIPTDPGAHLEAIISSSDDAIISTDLNGAITSWNRAAVGMFGYAPEEAVGQPLTILTPPARLPEEDFILSRVMSGIVVGHYQTMRLRRNGSLVDVSLTVSPLRSTSGEVIGALTIARDLAEWRGMERQALRLAAIIEWSDDAIVSKDLNGIIQTWNRGAERIFGYAPHEAIGRSIDLIIPDDRRDEETTVLRRIRDGNAIEHFETVRQTKDGRLIDISLTVSPIRSKTGEIIGASKIARDISEQKRLRRQADEASRLKDEFLATLSHELRTPLNTVLGYTAMLREEALSSEHRAKALDVIQRNADALRRLVDDILDASRIITGRVRLKRSPCRIDEVFAEAVETIRPAADAKHIEIHADIAPGLTVLGDADRIRQVFWNLLTNAVKFTPRGGTVVATARATDQNIRIRVTDTGIGIRPESLPYLFQRFWQAERADNREYGGLGLGLALARHFTELHGGSISATSEGPGKGATFQLELPEFQLMHIVEGKKSSAIG